MAMDFDDVLSQVLELLRRQGRVSYRALKVRLLLDDDLLEAVKDELIYAQQVASDEGNRVLIWTGETETIPVTTSQPNQPEPQPVVEPSQPIQETLVPVEPHTPEAERRQLTVMFCDLVESTALSGELDPEDYREVVREYQKVCTDVIQRYDGHVAQLLGDGLLVYFGFPQAHEDDAQRAVRTGLGIVEAIRNLNTRLEPDKGIKLAVRLGIHTGLVVVGEMGGSSRQEQLALGETPNIAARIQGIAEPDTVVISADTYRLIQGYFDCETLGQHELRGVVQPVTVYRVVQDTGVQSRLDIVSRYGLTPLVGREQEVGLLLDRWQQAKSGEGQVVLLSGEAGIGKSRLVQALKGHVTEQPHTRLEYRSSPYFTNSALYPITDFLQRTLRFQTDDTPEQKLEKLEQNLRQYRLPLEESVPLFATLLSLPVPENQYPPLNLSPQRQRQKTLEAIVAIILELAERQPVLFILEDLHWTDPTTLAFLDLLIDQVPTASMYVLLTCRPEFQPSWSHRSYLTEVTVNRLSQPQIERMAQQVADGKRLPDEIIQQLVDKTDGVPLYVEEMTKAVLESGVLKETNGQYELAGSLASLAIPATLQDSLMARLDRLVTAKAVAQYASVIGRQFSYELLQAVSQLNETMLQYELGRLVEAELVYQRGLPPQATYVFKHALVQDAAYQSLLRSTRQGYHRQIADILVDRFPETTETQPELLAHHYTEAGLRETAIDYWQQAGQRALQRSAYSEANHHLSKGFEVLAMLPSTPSRLQHELSLHITRGPALMATLGQTAPEVGRTYERARELCQQLGETSQLFPVLIGLWRFHSAQGQWEIARELGEQCLTIAQRQNDTALLLEAHMALGSVLGFLRELVPARTHLEQGIALYNPQRHHAHAALYVRDPGVICYIYAAQVLWFLGYPDQALARSQEAITLAQGLHHPLSLAYALLEGTFIHQLRREVQTSLERADAAIALSIEQVLGPWMIGRATIHRGLALAMQGQGEAGLAQIQQGLDTLQAISGVIAPQQYILLAQAHLNLGQVDEGLRILPQVPVTNWLRGELLMRQTPPDQAQAERCFQHALTVTRQQQAKSLELRAATSLAKLRQQQGKRNEAYTLLEPVYSWFTEGFDTADLIDAKMLLDELSEGT